MTSAFPQNIDLASALSDVQGQIRKDPANPKLRIYLFQLLCVLGDWERAATQLALLGDMDDASLSMVQAYREVLQCELARSSVFGGKHSPLIFGKPENWMALLIESLRATARGEFDASREARDLAFEQAPTSSGMLTHGDDDEQAAFEWIADADMRLGPMLEAIVNGKYYWIPFQQIKMLEVEAPTDLRDKAWIPANFVWINGGGVVGFIPSRYPDSEKSDDDAIRLARQTRWEEPHEGLYVGLGQRMLATDQGEFALLDIRRVAFDHGESAADPADGGISADGH